MNDPDYDIGFQYFLVSSMRYNEQNALSEAFWLLNSFFKVKDVKALLLTIPGLGILESKDLNRISEFNQDLLANLKDSIKFCKKIIPLEFYSKYSEQKLINWVIKAKNRLKDTDSWRITINKRQTSIKSKPLVYTIAEHIGNIGKVDLKKPDKIFQIEILGGFLSGSLLSPKQILSI